ncbi:MFS transporter [Lacisediminihabitans changchengi]|uniref:MFS transporter n=1 Tax=Lacisediminihabitans changchengi TaxID=2787634 RepID=A0A934W306_9MICO|nr:MFS transporter [Lacisediminihabitans changchengi]
MPPALRARRAWSALVLGVVAQTAGTVFVSTPAFLIPLLHTERGLSLAQAGLLAATPTMGMVLTLVLWGALADRVGEKWVIAGGLALTALATVGAITAHGYLELGVFLLLGGAASASTNSASGKVVVGWFAKERRGLAMGIRQMCQPLGVTVAALTVPTIAATEGIAAAFVIPLALTALLAVLCAIFVVNPPRGSAPAATGPAANPYRGSGFLWRIHLVSILLVVPQFTLSTFGLVWLVTQLQWTPLAAGILVGIAQFLGAVGRIGVGVLSDRVGSRVGPLRWVALSAVAVMLLLGASGAAGWQAGALVLLIAMTVTVADNGLAFTSVAEMSGARWSGRALGIQNTGQFVAASAVGPLVGGLIAIVGYPLAFLIVALFPAIAVPIVPARSAEVDRL